MEANAADVLTAIRETKDLSKETEALLNKAITTRVPSSYRINKREEARTWPAYPQKR